MEPTQQHITQISKIPFNSSLMVKSKGFGIRMIHAYTLNLTLSGFVIFNEP